MFDITLCPHSHHHNNYHLGCSDNIAFTVIIIPCLKLLLLEEEVSGEGEEGKGGAEQSILTLFYISADASSVEEELVCHLNGFFFVVNSGSFENTFSL